MATTQTKVDQSPSQTALFAALRRTLAHKAYRDQRFGPDNLAEIFLPTYYRFFLMFKSIRENTGRRLDQFMPGLTDYMIARTIFFDELFLTALKENVPQIVLLGAGYDSRAYRFASFNRGTTIFELDAAPTQARKIKCLKAARMRVPEQVHYIPIDFNRQVVGSVLAQAGYKNQSRTLFLWEGVSYYLERRSVQETLEFVSRCAHKDSLFAFDYTVPLTEDNLQGYYGAGTFAKSMAEHHANEELVFSLVPGEIEAFLANHGLRLIEDMGYETIEQKYLTGDDGGLIGRMTGCFRFACASPGKDND